MGDKKHIDRLFQEGFKDFEATPSDAVWENIEVQLNAKKKKHRVIPIWWRYAGAAALLLLLLTIGGAYYNNNDAPSVNQVTDTENAMPENLEENNSTNLNEVKNAIVNGDSNDNEHIENTESNHVTTKNLEEKKDSHKVLNTSTNNIANTEHTEEEKDSEKLQNTLKNTTSIVSSDSEKNKGQVIQENSTSEKEQHAINNLLNTESNKAVARNLEEKKDGNKAFNVSKNNTLSDSEKNSQVAQQNKTELINQKRAKEIINGTSNNKDAITEKENTEVVVNNDTEEENNLTIEEAINNTKDLIEEEENLNRWSIAPNAAPVYFNTLGDGSSLDPQLNNNSKSSELNISYGIAASYAINKKLSIRSGINRVNLGYNTNGVVVFQAVGISSSSRALQNVSTTQTNNLQDNVSLVSNQGLTSNKVPETFSSSTTSINQDLGYIEVPLEIQYALLNKKFGVNLIGGFSSFFLNNNEIFSESVEGERTFLGEATNINNVSYSANLGLGFNYQISKKIDLNLEPMFKYQINTFNNTSGDFKPYFIGVYTGFAIKF